MNLSEMSELLKRRSPYGFLISQALANALERRWREESGDTVNAPPVEWQGIKIVVDPDLPDTEFDAVFTPEMWSRRLADMQKAGAVRQKPKM